MALASPPLPSSPLGGLPQSVRPVSLAGGRLLPVSPPLAGLLPGGGLRRGSTVAVVDSTSLALAMLAGPSAAGSWCAVVGVATLGLAAAAEAGVDTARLAVVPAPGREWAAAVAALLDGLDVVAVRPPGRSLRAADARRLAARARERGAVLVPLARWDGADVRLSVATSSWEGVERGAGHLSARLVEVVADGRGAAARSRRAHLWLPSADGRVTSADVGPAADTVTGVGVGVGAGAGVAGGAAGDVAVGSASRCDFGGETGRYSPFSAAGSEPAGP